MDEMDRKILAVVQNDSSLSVADMAEKVGLSHTPFWRRLKRLEKDGVIKGGFRSSTSTSWGSISRSLPY